MKVFLIIIACLIVVIAAGISLYAYYNMNYNKAIPRLIEDSGYVEKQVTLPDGTVINYGQGPEGGIPLLLIHGQMVSWEDYARVLSKLSEHYHVYALDCHGHGKSSKDPQKYTAEAMGSDFIWFIENVIKEPVVISGHSSGGLLAAWLAANSPVNVRGIVIEDAPFFSTEPQRREKTFAWLDGFQTIEGVPFFPDLGLSLNSANLRLLWPKKRSGPGLSLMRYMVSSKSVSRQRTWIELTRSSRVRA